jgi:hypothetical protein
LTQAGVELVQIGLVGLVHRPESRGLGLGELHVRRHDQLLVSLELLSQDLHVARRLVLGEGRQGDQRNE